MRIICCPRSTEYFYPRPPGGGRHLLARGSACTYNFYPRPPGGGRQVNAKLGAASTPISIHALRVEGDQSAPNQASRRPYFYPRPPGGGRRSPAQAAYPARSIFLSTPSGWRATVISKCNADNDQFLSTPSGWRATLLQGKGPLLHRFLSTPSGWRATAKTDKVFICFCAKGRRICLFKTRKEKNLPVAF